VKLTSDISRKPAMWDAQGGGKLCSKATLIIDLFRSPKQVVL